MSSPSPPPPTATTTTHTKEASNPKAQGSFSVSLVFQRFRYCELLLNNSEWVSVGRRGRRDGRRSDKASATTTAAAATDESDDNDSESNDEPPSESQQQQSQLQPHCGLLVYVSFARHATNEIAVKAAHTIVNLPLLTEGVWGDGVSKTFAALSLNDQVEVDRSIVLVPQANLICKVKQQGKSVQYHGQASFAQGQELYMELVQHVRRLVDEHCSTTESATKSDNGTDLEHQHRCRQVEVVAGTFGTRQGLTIESYMGPFCHTVNL